MNFIWFIFIQLAIFGILLFVLKSFFSKNLEHATGHLSELESDLSRKTEEAQKKLAEANRYYDEALVRSRADSEKTKVQIITEAQTSADQVVVEARKQGAGILEEAKKARETILGEIDSRIRREGVLRAATILQEAIPDKVARPIHDNWVAEFMENSFASLKRLHLPEDPTVAAQIQTARELDSKTQSQITETLTRAFGRKVPVQVSVDPSLIAGLRVVLGSIVMDHSLRSKIEKAIADAKTDDD